MKTKKIVGQTMFKVIENQTRNITKNGFQNFSPINSTCGEKTIQKISADSVVPTYANPVNKQIFKVALNQISGCLIINAWPKLVNVPPTQSSNYITAINVLQFANFLELMSGGQGGSK